VQIWREPSEADAVALEALAPLAGGQLERPELVEAYERLREVSLEEQFEELLDLAADALAERDFASARRAAERARRLRPASTEIAELLAHVDLAEIAPPDEAAMVFPREDEAPAAAALLAGAYERALALDSPAPDADLAQSAALLLSGRREEGLSLLRELADREDREGRAARDWLLDPTIDPEGAFLREQRGYRVRRTLGWIGGDELEAHGLELSRQALRGWRHSLTPFNFLFGLPTRLVRGREARADELRAAARHYLEVEPAGTRADDAREWLAELQGSERPRDLAAWDDGFLRLPRAESPVALLFARPVRLSADALAEVAPDAVDLAELLDDETPVLALATAAPEDVPALGLPSERAFDLLARLAQAFDEGALRAASIDGASGAEAVRRLDLAVHDGAPLLAYAVPSAGLTGVASAVGALEESVVAGEEVADHEVRFRPKRKGIVIDGDLIGGAIPCPVGAVCVDAFHPVESRAFADLQLDGDAGVGLAASFGQAEVALRMSDDGPSASVTLPIARWLGLGRWLPLGARFGVGVDGLSVGVATVEPPPDPSVGVLR
jgi:hypothetical protein